MKKMTPIRLIPLLLAMVLLGACERRPVAKAPPPPSAQATPPRTQPVATAPAIIDLATPAPVFIHPATVARADHLAAIVDSETSSETEKVAACFELEMMGHSAASTAEALVFALRHPDPVRFHATRALLAIGPAAVPALRAFMSDGPAPVRYVAADVWAQIDVESGVSKDVLILRYVNGKPIEQIEAAVALQGVRERDYNLALLRGENRPVDPALSRDAIAAPESSAIRIEKLADTATALPEDPATQTYALKLLAACGPEAADAAPRIRPLLHSDSPAVADAACQALRAMGTAGISQLMRALKSNDDNVRLLATKGLANVAADRIDSATRQAVIGSLQSVLNNKGPGVRAAAASSLCAYGFDACPALVEGMKSGDDAVKSAVIGRLIESPRAFTPLNETDDTNAIALEFARQIAPALVSQMEARPDGDQWRIVVALSYLPGEVVGKELVGALRLVLTHETSGFHRERARDLLAELGPAGLPAMIEATGDKDGTLRLIAITALASRSETTINPTMISAMASALSDRSGEVRLAAFKWARRLPSPPPEVMEHISPFVGNDFPGLHLELSDRIAAAQLLGRFPANAVASVRALNAALDDPSAELQAASIIALRAYGAEAKPALPHLARIVQANKEPVARQAAETLLICGPEGRQAVAEYYIRRAALCEDRPALRSVLSALAAIGPDASPAVPQLQKWLADHDNSLRMEVADTLGKIGPGASDAVPALSRMADNADADVRQSATIAPVSISPDGKGLGPALMAAVYNGDRGCVIRLAAALQHADNLPPIIGRLDDLAASDPDKAVRAAAKKAVECLSADAIPVSTTQPAEK